MQLPRRRFLQSAAIGTASGLPIAALARRVAAQIPSDLVPDPDGLIDLAPGCSYRVLQRRGDPTSDGFATPGKMDGMACFEGEDDTWILLRNHEINPQHPDIERPFPIAAPPPENTYDPLESGGVSRVVVDKQTLEVRSSNLVLYGTYMNCGGGTSPWGWLTGEEISDGYELGGDTKHGYIFLCRPEADALATPEPIPNYGRFRHEAAVVDPATLHCYLTEDRPDGCFYRFVPSGPDTPFEGTLQALKVVGRDNFHTTFDATPGMVLDVEWVDVDDPVATLQTTRGQAQERGAALFIRGEGVAEHAGQIYVSCTTGGARGAGQIFRYTNHRSPEPLDPRRGGKLELLFQSEDPAELDAPDNIVVAPWGDVFICEDSLSGVQHLKLLTRSGEIRTIARNAAGSSEFAGVCFSPGGDVLFANIQHLGVTIAITGPFQDLGASADAGAPGVEAEDSGTGNGGAPTPSPSEAEPGQLAGPASRQAVRVGGGLLCQTTGVPAARGGAALAGLATAAAVALRRGTQQTGSD